MTGFEGFREVECTHGEMVHFHSYVTETLGQKSIVLDADDLQQDPGIFQHISTTIYLGRKVLLSGLWVQFPFQSITFSNLSFNV